MKWKPMEKAPRDGSLVALVWNDWSGVVAARWGKTVPIGDVGWFYPDWKGMIDDPVPDFPENIECADQSFAGWVRLPEFGKLAKKQFPVTPRASSREQVQDDKGTDG
jgi:hypothetical protein